MPKRASEISVQLISVDLQLADAKADVETEANEPPEAPEVHLDTALLPPEEAASQVIARLREAGIIDVSMGVSDSTWDI